MNFHSVVADGGRAFRCGRCKRVVRTSKALEHHIKDSHGADYLAEVKKAHRDEDKERARISHEASIEYDRRLAARRLRSVTLTTADIDEIIHEMNNLIGMMEPYWAQGTCDSSANDLIKRLETMADGRATSLSVASNDREVQS